MSERYVPHLENYTGPVTSLLIVQDLSLLISGCGNEISIYNLNSLQLHSRRQIFNGTTIHGIRKGPKEITGTLLCVFGGKQACIILLENINNLITITAVSHILHVEDWIWDIQWLNEENNQYIALALAHNRVLRCNWRSGEITDKRECSERCILYSASFIGQEWNNLVLAAGTVFNQVVIWPVSASKLGLDLKEQHEADCLLTLTGHKGVIFSIGYHREFQRICSVSDDRSIRMWQLSFPCGLTSEPSVDDWRSVKSSLMFSLFGHSARVWDVALLASCFISIAEDAVCLVWDYSGKILKKFKGHKARSIWSLAVSDDEKFVLTGGGDASIRHWEIDQLHQKETTHTVIPIAASCKESETDFPRSVQLLNFDNVLIMMNSGRLYLYKVCDQHFQLIVNNTNFRSYSILVPCPNEATIAIGTISGIIKIIRFTEEGEGTNNDDKFYVGKVLDIVWLGVQNILTSGPNGNCLLLKVTAKTSHDIALTVLHKLYLPEAKHRWITAGCFVPTQSGSRETLVCGDKDGSVLLYSFRKDISPEDIIEPDQVCFRIHGKAGTTFICYREGYIYTTGRDGIYRQWHLQDDTLIQLHGNKVVKGFEWIERLEWNKDDILVYGFFSSQFVVWSVKYNQQVMSAVCGGGHRSWGCCFDDSIMRFVYLKAGSIYMVDRGNLTKQTIIQPALHGREVCDVKFLHTFDKQQDVVHIVCTASEDNTINIGTFDKINNVTSWTPVVVMKGHLSSVRTLAISYKTLKKINDSCDESTCCNETEVGIEFLLFSGGGRADIRAWKVKLIYSSNKDSMKTSTVRNHCVSTEDQSNNFFQSHTDLYPNDDSLVREATLKNKQTMSTIQCSYEHLATHFLGESRHKQLFSSWKTHRLQLDPETRIMSLAASPLSELVNRKVWEIKTGLNIENLLEYHIISSAGSDGNFRIFLYDESLKHLKLLFKSSYHKGCMLKVIHYIHKLPCENISFAFSTSTNGKIVIWCLETLFEKIVPQLKQSVEGKLSKTSQDDSNKSSDNEDEELYTDFSNAHSLDENAKKNEWMPCCIFNANQSGINSLHILQTSENTLLVVSGGDDNAVCVSLLECDSSLLKLVAQGIKTDAHAAQINGIWLVSSTLLISASIDQRLNIWRIHHTENNLIELQILASKYVPIANITSLDVQLLGGCVHVLIGGEGVCLYSISLNDSSQSTERL